MIKELIYWRGKKRESHSSKTLKDRVIAKKGNSLLLLNFLRKDVTVEQLLQDKDAQDSLSSILGDQRVSEMHGKKVKGDNPYPAINYSNYDFKNGGGTGSIHGTFMLKGDADHLYFFNDSRLVGRVIIGGDRNWPKQLFNRNTSQWENDISIRIDNIGRDTIRQANGALGVIETLLSRLPGIN